MHFPRVVSCSQTKKWPPLLTTSIDTINAMSIGHSICVINQVMKDHLSEFSAL